MPKRTESTLFLLGYQSTNRPISEKEAQKKEVESFIEALNRVGFPSENLTRKATCVVIETKGTPLCVKEHFTDGTSHKSLCYGATVLAKSEKSSFTLLGPNICYQLFPSAINQLSDGVLRTAEPAISHRLE